MSALFFVIINKFSKIFATFFGKSGTTCLPAGRKLLAGENFLSLR
jgi:hypothetical protein